MAWYTNYGHTMAKSIILWAHIQDPIPKANEFKGLVFCKNIWNDGWFMENTPNAQKFIWPSCLSKPKILGFPWKKALLGIHSPWLGNITCTHYSLSDNLSSCVGRTNTGFSRTPPFSTIPNKGSFFNYFNQICTHPLLSFVSDLFLKHRRYYTVFWGSPIKGVRPSLYAILVFLFSKAGVFISPTSVFVL